MSRLIFLLGLIFLPLNGLAEPLDLDQLLNEVKNTQSIESKLNRQREARFLAEKNLQQQRLKKAHAGLLQQQKRSQQLKKLLQANEKELGELETALKNRSGVLGELFGVAKQAAGDLKADLEHSLVSAQFPGRDRKLQRIAHSKALPTIAQLQTLWFTLQQEMTESGKVVRFQTEILSASGNPQRAKVTRIGSFNALADGKYLSYIPETGKLVELPRQPEAKYTQLAVEFAQIHTGQAAVAVDPTRGVILGLLIQTPDAFERIQQGGAIGYIILVLGIAGFLYGIYRLLTLSLTGRKMHHQISCREIMEDNPLGRVLAAADKSAFQDIETLELILDEAITKEAPKLEKGLSMVRLLAAIAPLLGLLGTVTGMIATFQSISLFGTGDPKLMANGISQALVTTMLGLCVAIPLLFLHSLLTTRSRTLVQILDEQTSGLISRRAEQP